MSDIPKGYKQTEVGVIPKDWELTPLGHLVISVEYGSSTKSKPNGSIPVLRMGNLQGGKIDWGDLVYTDDDSEIKKYSLHPGEVLFNRTNTVDLVGKTSIYSGECPAIFAGYLIRINADPAVLESRYLNYVLNAEFSKKHSAKVLSMAVGQANINGQKLKTYPIPLPPTKAEQHAIAEALSDADALIESLEKLIAKNRQIKQGAMQELLTGKRRLPGFSGAWKSTTLGQIILRFSTGLNPRQNFRLNAGGNFYYVTIKNFAVGKLFLDDKCDLIDEVAFMRINERSDLRKDDILFASIGRVGDAYLIPATPRNWNINESVFALRPDKTQVVPLMLFYLLTNKAVKDALDQGVTGSTFKSIKQAELKAIPCRIPVSTDEQTAIAEILSDMDAEIEALEARLAKARLVKQGMMQELLTGRIRLV